MSKLDKLKKFMEDNNFFWYYERDRRMKCYYVHFKCENGKWGFTLIFDNEIKENFPDKMWAKAIIKEKESII